MSGSGAQLRFFALLAVQFLCSEVGRAANLYIAQPPSGTDSRPAYIPSPLAILGVGPPNSVVSVGVEIPCTSGDVSVFKEVAKWTAVTDDAGILSIPALAVPDLPFGNPIRVTCRLRDGGVVHDVVRDGVSIGKTGFRPTLSIGLPNVDAWRAGTPIRGTVHLDGAILPASITCSSGERQQHLVVTEGRQAELQWSGRDTATPLPIEMNFTVVVRDAAGREVVLKSTQFLQEYESSPVGALQLSKRMIRPTARPGGVALVIRARPHGLGPTTKWRVRVIGAHGSPVWFYSTPSCKTCGDPWMAWNPWTGGFIEVPWDGWTDGFEGRDNYPFKVPFPASRDATDQATVIVDLQDSYGDVHTVSDFVRVLPWLGPVPSKVHDRGR